MPMPKRMTAKQAHELGLSWKEKMNISRQYSSLQKLENGVDSAIHQKTGVSYGQASQADEYLGNSDSSESKSV